MNFIDDVFSMSPLPMAIKHRDVIFVLFAPKFKSFGVDLVEEVCEFNGDISIVALCTGGESVVAYVKENIKEKRLLKVYDIESLEAGWLEGISSCNLPPMDEIDHVLGKGASGEILAADRRVGFGYVRDGLCRPDEVSDAVAKNTQLKPMKYLQGLYGFFKSLFYHYSPKGVFCYSVSGAPALCLAKFASKEGAFFRKLEPARVGGEYVVDCDYKGRLDFVRGAFEREEYNQRDLQKAKDYLREFRATPSQPEYMIYNNKTLLKSKVWKSLYMAIIYSAALFFKPLLTKKIASRVSLTGLKRKFFELRVSFRRGRVSKEFYGEKVPCKYVYYPLHVSPESSTMVLSPMHTDQIAVIEALSKSLPGDMLLVVKEHLPMMGRRPTNFYKKIKEMPRVVLLRPDADSLSLIQASEAVVVITGTAALEAIMLKRNALIIGDSPLLTIPNGLIHEQSLAKLPEAISDSLGSSPVTDADIEKYLASIFHHSFTMPASMLWGEYYEHSEEQRRQVVSSIATRLLAAFEEAG